MITKPTNVFSNRIDTEVQTDSDKRPILLFWFDAPPSCRSMCF